MARRLRIVDAMVPMEADWGEGLIPGFRRNGFGNAPRFDRHGAASSALITSMVLVILDPSG
jgi:hypothetical protein